MTVQPVQYPTLIQLSGNSCWPGTGREPRQRQVRKLPGCRVVGMGENGRGPVRVGGTGGGEASACQLASLAVRCKRNFSGKEKLRG